MCVGIDLGVLIIMKTKNIPFINFVAYGKQNYRRIFFNKNYLYRNYFISQSNNKKTLPHFSNCFPLKSCIRLDSNALSHIINKNRQTNANPIPQQTNLIPFPQTLYTKSPLV